MCCIYVSKRVKPLKQIKKGVNSIDPLSIEIMEIKTAITRYRLLSCFSERVGYEQIILRSITALEFHKL
jgi:hypothetical protein